MKKTVKKLTLHRETLRGLSDLRPVVGGATYGPTVCVTVCLTNCLACNITLKSSCC
jgi:hypothetical protein